MSLHDHQYGNWKPKRAERIRKEVPSRQAQEASGNSDEHLKLLRTLPAVSQDAQKQPVSVIT